MVAADIDNGMLASGYYAQTLAPQAPSNQLAPTQPSMVVLSASEVNERRLASKFGG